MLVSHRALGSHLCLGKASHQVMLELLPYHAELSLWARDGCCSENGHVLINLWEEWHSVGFSTYKL